MPETTSTSHLAERYVPTPTPSTGAGAPPHIVGMAGTSADPEAASELLAKGQSLLHESRPVEAEPLLLRAVQLYERRGDMLAECVQVRCELASIASARGDVTAAESHLQRALALARGHLTDDHPDVATILGGLARLHLRRSEFTEAEPLLQRLLEIKRARGEDHPEVATVMASLASVHTAMGAHESAERILRRVLVIREKTLAPNHFATVTTLEHLAESCAARGKLDEALALLHRALTHRQRVLGPSHPSVATARSRIADLELLSSNEELGTATPLAVTLGTPLRPLRAPRQESVAFREAPPVEPPDVRLAPLPLTAEAPYEAWEDDVDKPQRLPGLLAQFGRRAAGVSEWARTPRGQRTVLGIGITSLLAALVLGVRTRADVVERPVNRLTVASARPAAPTVARSNNDIGLQPSFTQLPPTASVSQPLMKPAEIARRPTRATINERRSQRNVPAKRGDQETEEPITLPNAPRLRALEAPLPGTTVNPDPGPIVSVDFAESRVSPASPAASPSALGAPGAHFVHAVLPPGNPSPEYPAELLRRRVEGRVVAEFLVDDKGRADPRTLRIISSTHEEFIQAVRDLLPKLRFLPAESAGRRTEEWVAMPFRFSLKLQ